MISCFRFGLALVVFLFGPRLLCAQDWSELPAWSLQPKILSHQTTITVKPKFRIVLTENSFHNVEIIANTDISDVLAKAPNMLRDAAEKRSEKCGTRWSFRELAPLTLENGKIRLAGTIRARQYACALGAQVKLAQETADFVVTLAPTWTSEKVGLTAELMHFDLGNNAVGDLGLEDEIKEGLQVLLDKIIEGAALKIPPEIQARHPTIDEISLVQGDTVGLLARAHVTVTIAQFQELLAAFVALSAKP